MCKVLEKLLAKVKAHLVHSHIKVSTIVLALSQFQWLCEDSQREE